MFYFHIGDLISTPRKMMSKIDYETYFKETGTFVNRFKRYVKNSIGTGDAFEKMERLIKHIDFTNIAMSSSQITWTKTIKL